MHVPDHPQPEGARAEDPHGQLGQGSQGNARLGLCDVDGSPRVHTTLKRTLWREYWSRGARCVQLPRLCDRSPAALSVFKSGALTNGKQRSQPTQVAKRAAALARHRSQGCFRVFRRGQPWRHPGRHAQGALRGRHQAGPPGRHVSRRHQCSLDRRMAKQGGRRQARGHLARPAPRGRVPARMDRRQRPARQDQSPFLERSAAQPPRAEPAVRAARARGRAGARRHLGAQERTRRCPFERAGGAIASCQLRDSRRLSPGDDRPARPRRWRRRQPHIHRRGRQAGREPDLRAAHQLSLAVRRAHERARNGAAGAGAHGGAAAGIRGCRLP